MREIKFRGKVVRGSKANEWMYVEFGSDAIQCGFDYNEPYFNNSAVYRKTIGQYTGLKDMNGIEIYEHDILKTYINGYEYTGVVEYDINEAQWFGAKDYLGYAVAYSGAIVIGNIHDNPELLEVAR